MDRGKTVCFIDNSNIFKGQQSAGWKIDWKKFGAFLNSFGEVWQTHFFASEDDPPRAIQTGFYKQLKENLRWEIHLYHLGKKTVTCPGCRKKTVVPAEKGVDVGLATKMLTLGVDRVYETAIFVAGDNDYLETVRYIKARGQRVEIISWKGALARDLGLESSSTPIYFDDLKSKILRV